MHLKIGCLLRFMNEQPLHALDLSTLVHRLFAQRQQTGYDLFSHIQQDIERREALHDDILTIIDEQIRVHRNRLLEFQGWLKHDEGNQINGPLLLLISRAWLCEFQSPSSFPHVIRASIIR